ncbi:hypothetical protein [Mesorhizobium comanense]|uniref:hypothetical protein n=1 Tax=Mesorhizobium comanense TaxID=2502215 RepID=UPI0010F7C57E|nr:hypothetical protein [Mesorhizobium comanense]
MRRPVLMLSVGFLVQIHGAPARAEEFPIYNMDTYCRDLSGGDFAGNMECGEKEAAAYSKLQNDWASFPEKRKIECRNVAYDADTGKGSYALHLQCIEKGRKQVRPAINPSAPVP